MMSEAKRVYIVIAVAVAAGLVFQFCLVSWGFFWYRAEQQALFERELVNEGTSALQPAALLLFFLMQKEIEPDSAGTPEERTARLRDLLKDSTSVVVFDEGGRLVMGEQELAQYIVPGELSAQIQQARYEESPEFEYDNFEAFAEHLVEQPVFLRFRHVPNLGLVVGYGTTFDTRSVRLALNAQWSHRQILYLLGAFGGAILLFMILGLLSLRWVVQQWIGVAWEAQGSGRRASATSMNTEAEQDVAHVQAELNFMRTRAAALQEAVDEMRSDIAAKDREREAALQAAHRAKLLEERSAQVRRMNVALEHSVIQPLREAVAVGNGSANILADILRNYETLTGIAAPAVPLAQEVPVRSWLDGLIAASNPPVQVQVENHVPEDLKVSIDPDAAAICLGPLLANALAAAGQGEAGRVQVDAARQENGVEIRIIDNGPGIERALRPIIAEPFYSTAGNRSGLGLSRAHSMAAALGGGISLHSEEGRGTAAVLHLPES